jgi:hypothetical protein
MADLPISGLPQSTNLDGTELLVNVQGGVTKKQTIQNILDANLPITSSGITVSGDIVPTTPQGATLGSIEKPFREIYLQSGSISIESDTPGDPSALISNFNGNVDVRAAGFSISSGSVTPFRINDEGQIIVKNSFQDPANEAVFRIIGNNEASESAAVNPGSLVHVTGFDGITNRSVFDSYGGSGVFSQLILRNAAGTAANPTSTAAGIIGRVATSGYISDIGFGVEGATAPPASMNFYTPGYRSGSRETMIRFYATADNELDPTNYSAVIKAEGVEVTGSVDISGSLTASLQENYVWLGGSNNRSTEVSLDTLAASGSLIKKAYGSFFDSSTQSGSADTAYAVKHNTTDISGSIRMVDGTKITVDNAGVYTIISTQQFVHTSGGTATITGWLRKNGSDVPNSATDLRLKGNGDKDLYAINYMAELTSNDYVELMWSADDSDTEIQATAGRTSPTRPAVPSVITTINRVG